MLLFSTTLEIKDTLTKDKFVKLVIEWNQSSPHKDNVIPNINWNGEYNVKFGNKNLWLDIQEYKDIIAVRYERVESDGVIWDTDYVVDFYTRKMVLRLHRSYMEEAVAVSSSFSIPHLITLLINNDYIENDKELPVTREPIYITDKNVSLLADIISREKKFKLPIVYVSKTVYDRDPVNVNLLAEKLKGVAHVLVESSKALNNTIRRLCNDKNEYNGKIGIYYPNPAVMNKRFMYHQYTGSDKKLFDKVVADVIRYLNSQNVDSLYTWNGVINSLLTDRVAAQRLELLDAERAKTRAENEMDKVYDVFDDDLKRLQQQVADLTRNNEALMYENQGLRSKLDASDNTPVLYLGEEEEFYQGEIKDILLSVLEDALKGTTNKLRRTHIINDIIKNNNYQRMGEQRAQQIKRIFKTYTGMSGPIRQQLKELGFEITEEGKHYKLIYFGDERYWATLGKTPGDHKNGKNLSSEINNIIM